MKGGPVSIVAKQPLCGIGLRDTGRSVPSGGD